MIHYMIFIVFIFLSYSLFNVHNIAFNNLIVFFLLAVVVVVCCGVFYWLIKDCDYDWLDEFSMLANW